MVKVQSKPKSKVSKAEMSTQNGIFLEMTYAEADSKCFVKIQPYTLLTKREKGEDAR
jgi:hypothetical protein